APTSPSSGCAPSRSSDPEPSRSNISGNTTSSAPAATASAIPSPAAARFAGRSGVEVIWMAATRMSARYLEPTGRPGSGDGGRHVGQSGGPLGQQAAVGSPHLEVVWPWAGTGIGDGADRTRRAGAQLVAAARLRAREPVL